MRPSRPSACGRLERPTPYLLGLLNHPSTFPIHRASLAEHGSAFARAGSLVSNGPYRLVSWQIGANITLERNPFYWDAGSVAYDAVQFYPIEDASVDVVICDSHVGFCLPLLLLHYVIQNATQCVC